MGCLSTQVQYIKSMNLGGVMFWTLDQDDFSGTFCGKGRYPLLRTVDEECRALWGSYVTEKHGTVINYDSNHVNV